ncbi:MAG: histidine kinase N-terminal 7TM domain-containing protein [Candidatus Saccharibacteria bacterium]|nr:histidine kinase N-terminal 7TM domain-containing protein [Candidatus Saccharibacteria bacterium]
MRNMKDLRLSCFSPPVMIATFAIEIILAVHTLWRYKLNPVSRVAAVLLVCLATFQLAEYNVCEGTTLLDSAGWARLGYVAITLLPPLGIHLIARMTGDTRRWPILGAYGLGAIFVSYFLLATGGISAGACLGNYVIFEQGHGTSLWYGIYYYGLLFAGIYYAYAMSQQATPSIKRALWSLIAGYAAFMAPTTLVNIIDPSTIAGIPSIMCGFAVILALILSGFVLPEWHGIRTVQAVRRRAPWPKRAE